MTRSKGKGAVKTRRANEERVRDRERLREREKEWGGGERHHQNNYNKGHEDDLFGESKGQAGYGPMKGGKQWKGSLLAKEDSSEDESRSKSKSDEIRDRSPSGWSLACMPLSPTRDTGATPERS